VIGIDLIHADVKQPTAGLSSGVLDRLTF